MSKCTSKYDEGRHGTKRDQLARIEQTERRMTIEELKSYLAEGKRIADWHSWQERTAFQHDAVERVPQLTAIVGAMLEEAEKRQHVDPSARQILNAGLRAAEGKKWA